MRVTSEFWVSALVRRVFAEGGFAAVEGRGAREAGTVFIVVRDRFGHVRLFGPAAQASYDETRPSERRFTVLVENEQDKIDARLQRERRFDPDLWVVEIELADAGKAEDYFEVAAG